MTLPLETKRLIIRNITPDDVNDMYKLDSDKRVHQFLEPNFLNKSIMDAQKSVDYIISQYAELGIGRWAVIEKSSGKFIGWSGLKLNLDTLNGFSEFYDIGYRLLPEFWGQGYATESSIPALEYGFKQLNLTTIYGITHAENEASHKVLLKIGLNYVEDFFHEQSGLTLRWYQINKNTYEKRMS